MCLGLTVGLLRGSTWVTSFSGAVTGSSAGAPDASGCAGVLELVGEAPSWPRSEAVPGLHGVQPGPEWAPGASSDRKLSPCLPGPGRHEAPGGSGLGPRGEQPAGVGVLGNAAFAFCTKAAAPNLFPLLS